MVMDFTPFVSLQRELVKQLLVDTCKVYPATGTGTVNDRGVYIETTPASPRTYNGSEDIPCFVDEARAFFKEELKYQTTVTDNFYISFPADFGIEESDEIVWDNHRYEIRKLIRAGNMDSLIDALIVNSSKA